MKNSSHALISTGIHSQAYKIIGQRLRENRNNVTLLCRMVDICRTLGKLTEALAWLKELLLINPNDKKLRYLHSILSGNFDSDYNDAKLTGKLPSPFIHVKNAFDINESYYFLEQATHLQKEFTLSQVQTKENVYLDDGSRYSYSYKVSLATKEKFLNLSQLYLQTACSKLGVDIAAIENIEIKYTALGDKGFFLPHSDAHIGSRYLTFLYYFHHIPRSFEGGDLLLYDTDTSLKPESHTLDQFTRIFPNNNSLIFFPSDTIHEVLPIKMEPNCFRGFRFAINCHVNKKPII